jgi:site-specific recombinase XerD
VDKSDIAVTDLVQAFLMYNEDRNHSPKTVRWYGEMLGRFTAWLGPEARLRAVDADALRGYQRSLRGDGLSKFTLHAYARTLKTFLRWLQREAYISEELHNRVEMPKVPKYEDVTIDVLSDQEIAHLLAMLDAGSDTGCRNRAVVCLMLESGLRLAEVVNLKVDNVHLKEMYVKVHGKGDKESYPNRPVSWWPTVMPPFREPVADIPSLKSNIGFGLVFGGQVSCGDGLDRGRRQAQNDRR